ncbi:hypothetical protein SDC9_132334 [bioreactor metagenome]|uniref:Uncharacterized protein n=1 Tax=bioreactor metagenome TaxID=1076179 RepID=A0A645D7B5_9ZZZZ
MGGGERAAVHAERDHRVPTVEQHGQRGRGGEPVDGAAQHHVGPRIGAGAADQVGHQDAGPPGAAAVRAADRVGDTGEGDVALDQGHREQVRHRQGVRVGDAATDADRPGGRVGPRDRQRGVDAVEVTDRGPQRAHPRHGRLEAGGQGGWRARHRRQGDRRDRGDGPADTAAADQPGAGPARQSGRDHHAGGLHEQGTSVEGRRSRPRCGAPDGRGCRRRGPSRPGPSRPKPSQPGPFRRGALRRGAVRGGFVWGGEPDGRQVHAGPARPAQLEREGHSPDQPGHQTRQGEHGRRPGPRHGGQHQCQREQADQQQALPQAPPRQDPGEDGQRGDDQHDHAGQDRFVEGAEHPDGELAHRRGSGVDHRRPDGRQR